MLPSGKYRARDQVPGHWHTAPSTFRTEGLAVWLGRATRRPSSAVCGSIRPRVKSCSRTTRRSGWPIDRTSVRAARSCTAACSAAHPADAGRGRAGGDHAGQGPLLAGLINAGHPGASTISKAYRLLHAICATALEDGLIARKPVRDQRRLGRALRGAAGGHDRARGRRRAEPDPSGAPSHVFWRHPSLYGPPPRPSL